MFFSSNPKTVLYLTLDSIQLYQKGVGNSEILVLPKESVDGLEIKDKAKLEESVVDFLVSLKVKKQKIVFVLADSLITEETFSKKDDQLNDKITKFLDNLLFNKNQVAYKKFFKGEDVKVIAINKELLEAVGDVFEKMGWEIISVIPSSIVGIEKSSALTTEEIELVLKQYPNAQKIDFIFAETDKSIAEEISKNEGSSFLVTTSLILVVVGLIGGGVFVASRLLGFNLPNFEQFIPNQSTENIPEFTKAPEPTKSPEAIDNASKEFLKVNILNGSGIRGQAATIREVLLTLGYKDVETGNAEESGFTDTTIVFSKNVGEELQAELLKNLQDIFENIETKQTQDSGTFDIVLTTGKPKS